MNIDLSNFASWLFVMLGESAVVGALLLSVAFLFRVQIAQWLHRDMEKLKHEHQLQLEAYKVSLIADVEKSKLKQEIRKEAALKVIEKRFNAFNKLHEASVGNAVMFVVASGTSDLKLNAKMHRDCLDRLESFRTAFQAAEIFLKHEERQVFTDLFQAFGSFLPRVTSAVTTNHANDAQYAAAISDLYDKERAMDRLISAKIEEMMAAD